MGLSWFEILLILAVFFALLEVFVGSFAFLVLAASSIFSAVVSLFFESFLVWGSAFFLSSCILLILVWQFFQRGNVKIKNLQGAVGDFAQVISLGIDRKSGILRFSASNAGLFECRFMCDFPLENGGRVVVVSIMKSGILRVAPFPDRVA